jgi:very-short-patch-repair endonuclease
VSEDREFPPRDGEGDRAKRGGGGSKPPQRPVVYRARRLRRDMTVPERLLWQRLRQRPAGLKFRRQHPISKDYVVDFCCLSARLAIEIDGIAHDMGDRPARDERREKFIEENGFRVLRIAARRVLDDADAVAEAIVARASNPLHQPSAGPPPRSGEENC